jgi:hypothetical protein
MVVLYSTDTSDIDVSRVFWGDNSLCAHVEAQVAEDVGAASSPGFDRAR